MDVLRGLPLHPGEECFKNFNEFDGFDGFEELDGFEGQSVVLWIVLLVHAHQVVAVDIYSSPLHIDVDPPHCVTGLQCPFVVTPPFVFGGSES